MKKNRQFVLLILLVFSFVCYGQGDAIDSLNTFKKTNHISLHNMVMERETSERNLFLETNCISVSFSVSDTSCNNYLYHNVILSYNHHPVFTKDSIVASSDIYPVIINNDTLLCFTLFYFVNDLSSWSNIYIINISDKTSRTVACECIKSCDPYVYNNKLWFIDDLNLISYDLMTDSISSISKIYHETFFHEEYEYLDTYVFEEFLFYQDTLSLKFSTNGFKKESQIYHGKFANKSIILKEYNK